MPKVTLDLTEGEWMELANAVNDKASDIRSNRYGGKDEEDYYDPDEWAEELESAYQKICKALDEKGLLY